MSSSVKGMVPKNVVEGGEPGSMAEKESVWSESVRTSGIEGGQVESYLVHASVDSIEVGSSGRIRGGPRQRSGFSCGECNYWTYGGFQQCLVTIGFGKICRRASSRVWTLAIGIMTYEEQSRWNVAGRVRWEERTAPSGVGRGDSRYLIKIQLLFTRKRRSGCCGGFARMSWEEGS